MDRTLNKVETKICFISLGCDKNLIDSEIMLGIIDNEGYIITQNELESDILIINTCGFIMDATEEGIENILRLANYKREGKCKGLIVTGCMAQRYKEEIFKELPEVDAVVGTSDFGLIVEVIKEVIEGKQVTQISNINNLLNEELSLKRKLSTPNHFAYMKIAEGCDKHCTYCTIPSLRGKYRSRTMHNLIKEANYLAQQGVKELILVAQDTALYGIDLYGESKLHELLNKLSKIEDIKWIRILYSYPEHITKETIAEISLNEKICNYIDMPIQHSDNEILKKMGRNTNTEKLKSVISNLRNNIPDISIRTTLIVGFPGETQENFNNLVEFIKEIKFDKLGVFTYSKEQGTPAYNMPNQVDEAEKERRKNYIMKIQQDISSKKSQSHIGRILHTIVEGKLPEEENTYCGRSYIDCYEIDGLIFFNSEEELISGDFVNIHITHSSDYDLIGEIVNEPC